MIRLLAIETSSEACSVALSLDRGTIAREFHEPRRHAEILLPAIMELLAEADLRLAQLDAIAFGRGPGSFTSLRIGIGVVQGLAWGADLGVVPVSSLAALARGVTSQSGANPGATVVTAVDARMGEVFHAIFQVSDSGFPVLQDEEQVSSPGSVASHAGGITIGAGNGFQRYPELVQLADGLEAVYPELWPSATHVAELARVWLRDNPAAPAHSAQPVYIRDQVAEKPGGT